MESTERGRCDDRLVAQAAGGRLKNGVELRCFIEGVAKSKYEVTSVTREGQRRDRRGFLQQLFMTLAPKLHEGCTFAAATLPL